MFKVKFLQGAAAFGVMSTLAVCIMTKKIMPYGTKVMQFLLLALIKWTTVTQDDECYYQDEIFVNALSSCNNIVSIILAIVLLQGYVVSICCYCRF